MPRDVPSKHEVHAALERQVQLAKRRQREERELLATLRHAQVHVLGIDVATLTPQSPQGGHSVDTTSEDEAASS